MKRTQTIKHRINQKTANRKHARKKAVQSLRGSTKKRARHMNRSLLAHQMRHMPKIPKVLPPAKPLTKEVLGEV